MKKDEIKMTPLRRVLEPPMRFADIRKFAEYLSLYNTDNVFCTDGILFYPHSTTQPYIIAGQTGSHLVREIDVVYHPAEKYYSYLILDLMSRKLETRSNGQEFKSNGSDHIITVIPIAKEDLNETEELIYNAILRNEERKQIFET